MICPKVVQASGFQEAWLKASSLIRDDGELFNLVVHIGDVRHFDQALHLQVTRAIKAMGFPSPKAVAYTIFPHGRFWATASAGAIYDRYNRPRGFFSRLRGRRWGTYFRRLTFYPAPGATGTNQLDAMIRRLARTDEALRCACTALIPIPGAEATQRRGGPCLSYVAIQVPKPPDENAGRQVSMLAVYRNQDFLSRAYGNYWGLCNLLAFVARETGTRTGSLTCVSSHAYASSRSQLRRLLAGTAHE